MNIHALNEQFQAMESDSHVQAAEAGTPPPAAKKKRITVAELNKTIDELTELIDEDIFSWLDKLDIRVQHFENAEAEKPDSAAEGTAAHFKRLEDFIGNSTVKNISEMKARLNALEKGIAILQGNQSELMKAYTEQQQMIDAVTGSVNMIQGTVIKLSEQPAATEIEFAKPPEPPAAVSTRAGDIEAVASVCTSMGDVLMICRALRYAQDINMMDKNKILNTACRMVGVEPTHGLQIRAGIHNTGA